MIGSGREPMFESYCEECVFSWQLLAETLTDIDLFVLVISTRLTINRVRLIHLMQP